MNLSILNFEIKNRCVLNFRLHKIKKCVANRKRIKRINRRNALTICIPGEEVETGRDTLEKQKTSEPEVEILIKPEVHAENSTNEASHPLQAAKEDSAKSLLSPIPDEIVEKVEIEKHAVPAVEKTAPRMEIEEMSQESIDSNGPATKKLDNDWLNSEEPKERPATKKLDRDWLNLEEPKVDEETPVQTAAPVTLASNYKGKHFDPNFAARARHVRPPTRHSWRPPTPRAQNPRYLGKNFDPNYRPNLAARPSRPVTTNGDVNVRAASQFRPRFSGQRPRPPPTQPPFQYRPRQPRGQPRPNQPYRATAPTRPRQPRPTGYQGKNFRPDYRPRVRPQS